jgi:hypothetical protein
LLQTPQQFLHAPTLVRIFATLDLLLELDVPLVFFIDASDARRRTVYGV